MAAKRCRILVHSKPDSHGRQRFTMEWKAREYRHEKAPDGHPVGRRRGQCFNAQLKDYARLHCRVTYSPGTHCDAPAKRSRR